MRSDGAPPPVEPAPPLLGQQTIVVLGEWPGMSAGNVEALHEEGII